MQRSSTQFLTLLAAAASCGGLLHAATVGFSGFTPGNLVLSRSVYAGTASTITIGQQLPPVCGAMASCPGMASNNGAFPAVGSANNVWNNDLVDGSFGITSPIFLDQLTTGGTLVNTLAIPATSLTTSFSSKSELALNLSTDGTVITFMGYSAPVNTLDVSNSNTPGVIDPTNPVGSAFYRIVGQVDAGGNLLTTDSNAYSGNNGRAAILANGFYYTVGNDNNGAGTPANIIDSTGAEILTPFAAPGTPVMIGNFSITQVINPATGMPYAADKPGKDDNFRGLTIFNNTLYVTKGSGGNGINTVYQVGNAGSLPTLANASTAPITILPGFPVTLAKASTAQNPFGLFFATANTLYVADEGDGTAADAATSPNAGLQKWVLSNGVWTRVYVLRNGLNLGQPYSVSNYPTSLNPSTDGLRNITGRVNADGTATIWAITSTVSANGDQGADPNELVEITDVIANTNPAAAAQEQFTIVRSAGYGEVLRGIAFTPGTSAQPAPAAYPVTSSGFAYSRAGKTYSATLTIANNTNSPVSGPISVALAGLPQGASVVNATSTVSGMPAVQIVASGTALNPGQSASTKVLLSDPSNAAIQLTATVVFQ
ncbi:MAG TPA: hypothetical protein VKG25_01955 [Bryobacteraceae bacterium]|nr:hypothetical protein [Bryobacteraceae bacterium]